MPKFFQEDDLLDRLKHVYSNKDKEIVFIVGSPVTASNSGISGVLDVEQIVDLIRSEFAKDKSSLSKLDDELASASQHPYQSAFEFVMGRRGPAYANQIIRKAVLNARKDSAVLQWDKLADEKNLTMLEQELDQWCLPRAADSLGALCVDCKDILGKTVLTTNFDPILEISIRRSGGEVFSSMTHGEGNIAQSTGPGTHVVHLHGYWRGSDTLHTPTQLSQSRQQLKSSLVSLIKNTLVVVIGYGGWDDVITDALATAVSDDTAYPEIIWTFYSNSDHDIQAKNINLIEKLSSGLSRGRVAFYKGIDCHSFFPLLHSNLVANTKHERKDDLSHAISIALPEAHEDLASIVDIPLIKAIDAFPKNEFWFGREAELQTLLNTTAKVISISGMGGQGKSALASTFMQHIRASAPAGIIVDWRDCREQSSTIHLAISGAASRLLSGKIKADDVAKLPIAELISLFVSQLSAVKGVFVFDNIDNYVDLETSYPLGQVNDLIEAVIAADTPSKFIFTSRPRINLENVYFQEIQLAGLSKEASKDLFENKSLTKLNSNELADLYELTQGHPLWISIIAAQCAATRKPPLQLFNEIRSGKGDLPEKTMRATWTALSLKGQHLLRVLAELERPEELNNLDDLANMRWNQLSKALSNLKKMSLIVPKEQEDGKELIDLHPLIRQFVRKEFPKKDRETFINQVITFVERRLDRFNKVSGVLVPFEVLDIWVHKMELLINQQNYEVAIETLDRVHLQLQARGLHEEVVRLGKRIFQEMNWVLSISTVARFDAFVSETIHAIVALEGAAEAERWINKYEGSITGKGGHYINICELRAYVNWFEKNYPDAIHWGNLGVTLKKDYDVKTPYDCAHTLALAKRDSGKAEDAIDFFLEGLSLDECLGDSAGTQKNGAYYGNVGRCLQFMGQSENALRAYKIAASRFETIESDALNQGYLRFWVGEVSEELGRIEDALFFYLVAIDKWKSISPAKAAEVQNKLDDLTIKNPSLVSLLDTPIWKAENRFVEWSRTSGTL